MWKEPVVALSGYRPGICLLELEKTTKNLIEGGRYPGRDSKRAPLSTSIQLYHCVNMLGLYLSPSPLHLIAFPSSLYCLFSTSSSYFLSAPLSAQLRVRGPRDPINFCLCHKEDWVPLDSGTKPLGSWKEKCWWGPSRSSSSLKIALNISLSNYLE
jgi:hypothetical protein